LQLAPIGDMEFPPQLQNPKHFLNGSYFVFVRKVVEEEAGQN
jgi:hypothetical protein